MHTHNTYFYGEMWKLSSNTSSRRQSLSHLVSEVLLSNILEILVAYSHIYCVVTTSNVSHLIFIRTLFDVCFLLIIFVFHSLYFTNDVLFMGMQSNFLPKLMCLLS